MAVRAVKFHKVSDFLTGRGVTRLRRGKNNIYLRENKRVQVRTSENCNHLLPAWVKFPTGNFRRPGRNSGPRVKVDSGKIGLTGFSGIYGQALAKAIFCHNHFDYLDRQTVRQI